MTNSILIVEDEPPMQARLHRVLVSMDYAGEAIHCAGNLAQGKALAQGLDWSMALVDLGLPDGSGIELISWLRERDPESPILVISAWSIQEMILDALRAGASGYVLKERDDTEIALSMKNALKGGAPIDPIIARGILNLIAPPNRAAPVPAQPDASLRAALSARERDILKHVAEGMSNREIARAMTLSPWTVDTHVRSIYRKLAVMLV